MNATIIQLSRASTKRHHAHNNLKAAHGIEKAAARIAADTRPIHAAWVTIVRPGGMVEQIECLEATA